jgi:hypothetical protein
MVFPRVETLAVGDKQPPPPRRRADRLAKDAGKHRPAYVVEAAFGFQAFAPAVLVRLAHHGTAEGGEIGGKSPLQGEALPVVPWIRTGNGGDEKGRRGFGGFGHGEKRVKLAGGFLIGRTH